MTTEIQTNTDFRWEIGLHNLPILLFFGEVCKTFGFPSSYDIRHDTSGFIQEVWEHRGLYYYYPDLKNRKNKNHADVNIVCTKEETRDIILEILSGMAEKRRNKS